MFEMFFYNKVNPNPGLEAGHTSPNNKRRCCKMIPRSSSTHYFIPHNIFWIFNNQKNFFDSRMCDNRVTNEEFQDIMSKFRMKYANDLKKDRLRHIILYVSLFCVSANLLSPLILKFAPQEKWIWTIIGYYILFILFLLLKNARSLSALSQLMQNLQLHFDHYNNTKYHRLGLHFRASYSYIQLVLNYKDSDADLYTNDYLAKLGIAPAFQPGHYYFYTDLFSAPEDKRKMKDTFNPNKIENRISAAEYRSLKENVRSLILEGSASNIYNCVMAFLVFLCIIIYFWYPVAVAIFQFSFPEISVLFMFVIEAILLFFLVCLLLTASTAEDKLMKRTQEVIDQESAKLPNAKKYRWKIMTVEILKLQYKVGDANNEP